MACGGNWVTSEEFNARMTALEEADRQQEQQISSIRECEYWRTRYTIESENCITGLSTQTLEELEESGETISAEVITTRRYNACEFACMFEIGCEHETRITCAAAGFNTENLD